MMYKQINYKLFLKNFYVVDKNIALIDIGMMVVINYLYKPYSGLLNKKFRNGVT